MAFHFKTKHWLIVTVPVCIAVITLAWQKSGADKTNNNYRQAQDTVPSKHHQKDFEEMRDEKDLDKAILKLDEALKHVDKKIENIDWNKIQEQIQSSMEKVNEEMKNHQFDMDKVQHEVEESMKNIDLEKIKKETALAMQHVNEDIDLNKINEQVQRALDVAKEQLNSDEIQKSIQNATKMNMEEVKKELENVKIEMEKNKVNVKEEMAKAKIQIEEAKQELKAYKQLLDGLEKDGLINAKKDYSIEYKNGELFINGQKQPQDVLNKYKGYFKHDNTKIYKENGRFNIDID